MEGGLRDVPLSGLWELSWQEKGTKVKITPVLDRILVKRQDVEDYYGLKDSSLVLPDEVVSRHESQSMLACVLAVGPDVKIATPGQWVATGRWSGTELVIEGQKHLIIREHEVNCIVEKD